MFRSLYGRMAAALVMLFFFLAAFQVAVQVWGTRRLQLESNQRLNRNLAANLVSQGLAGPGGKVDSDSLKDVFHSLMVVNPSIEVYLLDAAGRILNYSAPPGRVQLQRVSLAPIQAFLTEPEMLPVLGDDPRDPGRSTVFSVAPVGEKVPPENYLYIVLAGEQYQTATEAVRTSQVTRLSIGLVVAAAVAVSVAGLVLFGLLTRRLRRLAVDVTAPVGGRFNERVVDEVDRLEATFRSLTARIQEQLEAIRGADEERRRLLTNISHDLKTPLASMQGHLETLLVKEEKLGEGERRQYLHVAVSNARRLTRLIAELFDLARLDAPEMTLNREPFALAELVQDVVQKLRVVLEGAEVGVTFRVPTMLPPVYGDIGLVERAVENVLTNAIRHSPPDTSLEVEFEADNDHVSLRVCDHGPGIPPEELPHIFERFYRGAQPAPRPDGSGLGLAIVRRIAELHGGSVVARNRPGGGACFTFELPCLGVLSG